MDCPITRAKMWDELWEILKSPYPTTTPRGLFSGLIVGTRRSWCLLLNQNQIPCDPNACRVAMVGFATIVTQKATRDQFKHSDLVAYWNGILRRSAREIIEIAAKQQSGPKELDLGKEVQLHRPD